MTSRYFQLQPWFVFKKSSAAFSAERPVFFVIELMKCTTSSSCDVILLSTV